MFGIYEYKCGLQFTGKVARTEQEAKNYIAQTYGKTITVFTGKREADGTPIYERKFCPGNVEHFVIRPVELV